MSDETAVPTIAELLAEGRFEELIAALRQAVKADRRALAEPAAKRWVARRWRNLFVTAAARDPKALRMATGGRRPLLRILDAGDPRERVARRFLHDAQPEDWADDLPEAPAPPLERTTVVFGPGLLNGMLPVRALAKAFVDLERRHGWTFLRVDAHPVRGCAANVADYVALLEQGRGRGPGGHKVQVEPPEEVLFLVYSKGASDLAQLLVDRPDLAPRIRAVFSWAGSFGGSWVADDAMAQVADVELPDVAHRLPPAAVGVLRQFAPLVALDPEALERIEETDVMAAMRDLSTSRNREFLARHAAEIDALDIPFFTLAGCTDLKHVPTIQAEAYLTLAAHDEVNDMQLTRAQTDLGIPMSIPLGTVSAHHWDIAFESFPAMARALTPNLRNPFPGGPAVEALVRLAIELGLAR